MEGRVAPSTFRPRRGLSRYASSTATVPGAISPLNQNVFRLDRYLTNLSQGSNTLEVNVGSDADAYITVTITAEHVLNVTITEPPAGAALYAETATVRGTHVSCTDNVGIAVNGIVCQNEEEARRDRAQQDEIVASLREKIAHGPKKMIGNTGYRRYVTIEKDAVAIDEKKIAAEGTFDGIYVLRTNTELSAKEAALAYKGLWQMERAFREIKSTLEIRPGEAEYRIRTELSPAANAIFRAAVVHVLRRVNAAH